jgi:hypothetical protein
MFKIRQGLTLQQSPKHPGLVRRFLHGHQFLNLPEGHHPLDPMFWASILEDSKLSGVLGASSWIVWIHEKLQIFPFRLVRVRLINLVHLLHLGNKRNGAGVLAHRRRQSSGGFGKLTHQNPNHQNSTKQNPSKIRIFWMVIPPQNQSLRISSTTNVEKLRA